MQEASKKANTKEATLLESCSKISRSKVANIREKLEVFLPLLVDFKIYSMSLSVANFGKINISINSDGNIKIKRSVGSSIERKI